MGLQLGDETLEKEYFADPWPVLEEDSRVRTTSLEEFLADDGVSAGVDVVIGDEQGGGAAPTSIPSSTCCL